MFHLYFCNFIDLLERWDRTLLCGGGGGFQTAHQTLLWVMRVFQKVARCKAMMSCYKGSISSCDITTTHVGVEATLKWFSIPSAQRPFTFVLFFASFLFLRAAAPPIFLQMGGLTHTLFVDVPLTFLPFCWTCLTSPRRPPVKMSKRLKKKKGCSSFISLTCSYFYKKAPHKIYIYSFAHVGASLHTTCPDDVSVNLASLLKVFAGCSTWKVLPLLRRKDIFMLNSCCKIHWMSLLLSKALLRHVAQ